MVLKVHRIPEGVYIGESKQKRIMSFKDAKPKQQKEILRFTCSHTRTYFTKKRDFIGRLTNNPQPFAVYFFNEEDEEIGYYICDTVELLGCVLHENPRIWSDEFKNHPNYGKPIDPKTSCVKTLNA